MPEKTYRIRKKGWFITVSADSPSQARYRANEAYTTFLQTGRKVSYARFDRADETTDTRTGALKEHPMNRGPYGRMFND